MLFIFLLCNPVKLALNLSGALTVVSGLELDQTYPAISNVMILMELLHNGISKLLKRIDSKG